MEGIPTYNDFIDKIDSATSVEMCYQALYEFMELDKDHKALLKELVKLGYEKVRIKDELKNHTCNTRPDSGVSRLSDFKGYTNYKILELLDKVHGVEIKNNS